DAAGLVVESRVTTCWRLRGPSSVVPSRSCPAPWHTPASAYFRTALQGDDRRVPCQKRTFRRDSCFGKRNCCDWMHCRNHHCHKRISRWAHGLDLRRPEPVRGAGGKSGALVFAGGSTIGAG